MRDVARPAPAPIRSGSGAQPSLLRRWRSAWDGSLRFRLLALGLTPLLMAFPLVIAILLLVGGESATSLLRSNLRGNLAGAQNYLDQLRIEAGMRVGQLVKSERLIQLLDHHADPQELDRLLATTAKASGLDYLVIAAPDGRVLASSAGTGEERRLPESYVTRQARIGVANAAYERVAAADLASYSPQFPALAGVELSPAPRDGPSASSDGLLINAAAHFPLAVGRTDAILVGGVLLNRNFPLIEHMREIIYPLGALPGESDGMTSIHVDDVSVAISRQRAQGQRVIGTRPQPAIREQVIGRGEPWHGGLDVAGQSYVAGFQPLVDGEGRRIGMIGAGFPDAPYVKALWILLGTLSAVLALTMLGLSVVFLRAGRELTQRLAAIGATMTRVGHGQRDARVGAPLRHDELGQLGRHFDGLLDTIAAQDAMQREAQQTIADEAARRRTLFEHERDGIAILNPDGSVLEANPKCAAMLGYTVDEMSRLHVTDWQADFTAVAMARILGADDAEGEFFETLHRRRDGTTYAAEISASKARWGDRTLLLLLQRDISERKATEAELESYRLDLEKLVAQRTEELNVRTEQLDAIFTLSPDGFVSFGRDVRVAFANRAFLRMIGVAAGDVVGLDEAAFSALLARRCLPTAAFPGVAALRAARRRHVDGTQAGQEGAARRQLIELDGPGGRVLEVGIRMAETESVSQVLYFRDVTHETEVDRMKSEFLSTAAHELRTPMASIYGFAELLQAEDFDRDTQRDVLGTIFRQSSLMVSIINELLDLARIEARRGKDFLIERVAVQEIVVDAVAGFKPPTGRAQPVLAAPAVPLPVNGDRKKLQQALLNILSNAYKYSPDGGDVEVAYRVADSEGSTRVGIEVRDHGIGMTAKEASRVCERFYRADASGKIPGTGLGMSIVKEIVELHGGEVELVSEPGAGTAVTLWIPRAAPAAA